MNFASDNIMGASAPVLDALVRANNGAEPAYGGDSVTKRVEAKFAELFERDVKVFLVATGTAANALCLAAAVPPWGICVSHRESHIVEDECGAPEFFAHGAKFVGLPGHAAKLSADDLDRYVSGLPKASKQMPPKAVSLSQATECGTVYRLPEIAAISAVCRKHGLALHMDGARFANAMVSLGCSAAEMTWKQGVDILSFGATKNGCLSAEAIVVFDEKLAETLEYRRKRAGQTLSKGRLLAAQFEGYFADNHWLGNARHANAMARMLAEGLAKLPGVRIAWSVEANEVFPILPVAMEDRLKKAGALFHRWSKNSMKPEDKVTSEEALVRLVTSFATEEAEIRRFLDAAIA